MHTRSTQSGYTLLFAVITAALVLGIAAFVLSIARKQYILSSTARNSIYSFYAADSGIECVSGSKGDIFATTSTGGQPDAQWYGRGCDYQTPKVSYNSIGTGPTTDFPDANGTIYEATFNLGFAPVNSTVGSNSQFWKESQLWGCAEITIDQYADANKNWNEIVTSRGYNFCTNTNGTFAPDVSRPDVVERALVWSRFI